MSNEHTPGPWHIEHTVHVLDENRTRIADVCDRYDGTNNNFRSSAEANARLIAAAPELLEALEKLLAATSGHQEFRDAAYAAINKAKGF